MIAFLTYYVLTPKVFSAHVVASLLALAVLVDLPGCSSRKPAVTSGDSLVPDDRTAITVDVLTYNVAGLPDFISSSHPAVNNELIGSRLNAFDIVLVQEDFWYHRDLSSGVSHPYVSVRARNGLFCIGDGLNRFAAYAFDNHRRWTWNTSHGVFRHSNDALAPKGFTVATHYVTSSIAVDVYNLHLDAGGHYNDYLARKEQIGQLTEVIESRSDGLAVIVAGDWNLSERRPDDIRLLEQFKDSLAFRDAREDLAVEADRIDRILYRSGGEVEIVPLSYHVELELFRDGEGNPLSDHDAISVEFALRTRP